MDYRTWNATQTSLWMNIPNQQTLFIRNDATFHTSASSYNKTMTWVASFEETRIDCRLTNVKMLDTDGFEQFSTSHPHAGMRINPFFEHVQLAIPHFVVHPQVVIAIVDCEMGGSLVHTIWSSSPSWFFRQPSLSSEFSMSMIGLFAWYQIFAW